MIAPAKSLLLLALTLFGASLQEASDTASSAGPEYTADGQLKLPAHYRDWIYLSSDFYVGTDPAKPQMAPRKGFINVFVDPAAYRAFLQTGTWADKTMFVAEMRGSKDMPSTIPNSNGSDQRSVIGVGVHLKDSARFGGKWAFFDFKGGQTAKMLPATAACYTCHAAHAALDTTFVQFYPTLLPTAKTKNTLSAEYQQQIESAAPAQQK